MVELHPTVGCLRWTHNSQVIRKMDLKNKNNLPYNIKNDIKLEPLVPEFLERLSEDGYLELLVWTKEQKYSNRSEGLDLFARRFIKAEKYKLKKSIERAKKYIEWRNNLMPKGFISDEDVMVQLEQGKVFLYENTKDGRPILVIKVARHIPLKEIETLKKFVIYCLEVTAWYCDRNPRNPDGTFYALFDLDGVKWKNMDASGLKECFSILEKAFPERVSTIFMLNSPFIFDSLWKIVKPFVDPTSREKIKFIYGVDGLAKEAAGVEALPKEYGGIAVEKSIEKSFADANAKFEIVKVTKTVRFGATVDCTWMLLAPDCAYKPFSLLLFLFDGAMNNIHRVLLHLQYRDRSQNIKT